MSSTPSEFNSNTQQPHRMGDAKSRDQCHVFPEWNQDVIKYQFQSVDVVPFEGVVPGGGAPVKCYQGYNVSQLVDYVPPGEFSVEFCTRGYCRGNPLTTWYLADVNYPCAENREGLLCGQCKPGYAVTFYSTVSLNSALNFTGGSLILHT